MPGKLYVTAQKLGTFLRLKCVSVHSAWCSSDPLPESENIHIKNLATVRLQFEREIGGLVFRIKATNHAFAKDIKVKVNVSCQELDFPFYSEWICDDAWKEIGKKRHPNFDFENCKTNLLDINIHVSKVEESLEFKMKLYSDVTFTDFKLSTDQGSVPVHRAYLAAHSDVFQAMLSQEWKETKEGRIELNGVTLETLQHLKEYMYLQTLPDKGLESLILLAACYLIDGLVTKCASKLALTCKSEDYSRLLAFAAVNNIPELMCAIQMMFNPINARKALQTK